MADRVCATRAHQQRGDMSAALLSSTTDTGREGGKGYHGGMRGRLSNIASAYVTLE